MKNSDSYHVENKYRYTTQQQSAVPLAAAFKATLAAVRVNSVELWGNTYKTNTNIIFFSKKSLMYCKQRNIL